MFTFDPPSNIDDLDTDQSRPNRDAFRKDWHGFIKGTFDGEIGGLNKVTPKIEPLFASEADGAFPGGDIPITWNAFPLAISRSSPQDVIGAWKSANQPGFYLFGQTRVQVRRQDEYCEWHEYRDGNKLTKIVFSAEAPEYWVRLARRDIDRVVELYQTWVSPNVNKADLLLTHDLDWFDREVLKAGTYNPYNKWNTTDGVMHLTHPNNTLGAEIDLAARATLLRGDHAGKRVTDVRQLACSSDFGNPNRSSDPNIGSAVNSTCVSLDGATVQDVTLANPVALYIGELQSGTLTGPNDEPLDDWFQIVRGVKGRGLMAVLAPPANAAFGLDQVKVKGVPLEYGGQIAEVIQMVLYGKARPHVGAGGPVHLFASLDNCCAPIGTPRTAYKKINFASPDDKTGSCDAGFETAYRDPQVALNPELLGARLKLNFPVRNIEVEKEIGLSGPSKRSTAAINLE